jgi:DNA-binding FadR family transcriptional regulator
MTVQELIEALQELDADLVVVVRKGKHGFIEANSVRPGTFVEDESDFEEDVEERGANDAVLID